MRLVLINPKVPESFWSFRWAVHAILPNKRALNPPLGLATLAALTPPDWQVEIYDENIEPAPERPNADIVGIGGMGVQVPRQKELIAHYCALSYYVDRRHALGARGAGPLQDWTLNAGLLSGRARSPAARDGWYHRDRSVRYASAGWSGQPKSSGRLALTTN